MERTPHQLMYVLVTENVYDLIHAPVNMATLEITANTLHALVLTLLHQQYVVDTVPALF
jgi:hypothetical protein